MKVKTPHTGQKLNLAQLQMIEQRMQAARIEIGQLELDQVDFQKNINRRGGPLPGSNQRADDLNNNQSAKQTSQFEEINLQDSSRM